MEQGTNVKQVSEETGDGGNATAADIIFQIGGEEEMVEFKAVFLGPIA